jgi:hypothetical protein
MYHAGIIKLECDGVIVTRGSELQQQTNKKARVPTLML